MKFCSKCGTQLADDARFCTNCGAQTNAADAGAGAGYHTNPGAANATANVMHMEDHTAEYDMADIRQNKVMAVLSYIGILVLIPIFAAPHSRYARFHANQGLVLFLGEIAAMIVVAILGAIAGAIFFLFGILFTLLGFFLSIAFIILSIMGIVNAATDKAKELPIIGKIKILH